LPGGYSHYGSRGICVTAIFQNSHQPVRVWGKNEWQEMWSAATVKLIGPGIDDPNFAEELSKLIGQTDQDVGTQSNSKQGSSYSVTVRQESILSASEIRTIDKTQMLMLATATKPAMLDQVRYYQGEHASELNEDEKNVANTITERAAAAAEEERLSKAVFDGSGLVTAAEAEAKIVSNGSAQHAAQSTAVAQNGNGSVNNVAIPNNGHVNDTGLAAAKLAADIREGKVQPPDPPVSGISTNGSAVDPRFTSNGSATARDPEWSIGSVPEDVFQPPVESTPKNVPENGKYDLVTGELIKDSSQNSSMPSVDSEINIADVKNDGKYDLITGELIKGVESNSITAESGDLDNPQPGEAGDPNRKLPPAPPARSSGPHFSDNNNNTDGGGW